MWNDERRGVEGYGCDIVVVLGEMTGGVVDGEVFGEVREGGLEGEVREGVGGGAFRTTREESKFSDVCRLRSSEISSR